MGDLERVGVRSSLRAVVFPALWPATQSQADQLPDTVVRQSVQVFVDLRCLLVDGECQEHHHYLCLYVRLEWFQTLESMHDAVLGCGLEKSIHRSFGFLVW